MKKIDEIITEYFGYSLKKEQREIIELIINGRVKLIIGLFLLII